MASETKSANRREFLLKTASATAGVTLLSGLNIARSAHVAGSDELKIALIGCGGRGAGAVRDCLTACQNVKLVALADAFEDNAQGSLAQLQKIEEIAPKLDVSPERIFVGFDAYRQAINAGADIVFLATPPGFRPIHYAAAIEAGKHVFMEKPCCVDAPGYRSFLETNKLADQKDLKVVVGLQRRYSQEFIGKVQEIRDGALGKIYSMRAYWNQGPIWIRSRQPGQSEMEYQMRNWYHFLWLSGDHIVEQHVHNLDVCNWVKNAHPIEANGMGSCHVRDNRGIGQIYDNHFVEFTYEDGTKLYSQCRQQANTWNCVSQFIHGSEGVRELPGNGSDGYVQEHVALITAIREGKKLNDGWHAADSSFTGVLGRMATYSGKVVRWDEAVERGPNEMPQRFAFDADPPVMPDKDGNYPMPLPGVYCPY